MEWIYEWFKLKSSGENERWEEDVICMVDQNHERSVEYNIENEEGILIQAKGNYCSKLKEGKLKTKKLLKISRYIRWTISRWMEY